MKHYDKLNIFAKDYSKRRHNMRILFMKIMKVLCFYDINPQSKSSCFVGIPKGEYMLLIFEIL